MKGSLDLGSVTGIKIRVHWTFLLLIPWIVFLELSRGGNTNSILWSLGFVMVLFACVVLHELGHALTARRFKINTRQITLLPIGGVASLESMPEDPKEELLVAIAGPMVNIVIAIILYFLFPIGQFFTQDLTELEQLLSSINAGNFFFYLFSANVMLVLFNLLPAFPMDGGRVLRAILSMKMNRVSATQVAAKLGQAVAFLFFFIGLFYNPLLILIAIFVYFGAQGENVMIQQLALLKDHKVKEAMMTDITVLHPDDTLERVIDVILSGAERDFVVSDNGEIKGVLLHSDILEAIKKKNTHIRVNQIMRQDYLTISMEEDLTEIYRKVRSKNEQFFPVLQNGQLKGAIDMTNINEFMIFRASLDF